MITGYSNTISVTTTYDSDAQAFFDRVTAAGGTLTTTEKNATNKLVLDMKSAGIWTAMRAVYPMVGASAAACAQNLKSSSFTGTFSSGWTFASTGAKPNGTSAYFNTNFNPNGLITSTNSHLSLYQSNATGSADRINGIFASQYFFVDLWGGNSTWAGLGTTVSAYGTSTNKNAMHILTAPSSTAKLFRNTTQSVTWTSSGAMPNLNTYFGAANDGTNPVYFTDGNLSFCSLGDGLTDTQAADLYNAVQIMNTTLSRNV